MTEKISEYVCECYECSDEVNEMEYEELADLRDEYSDDVKEELSIIKKTHAPMDDWEIFERTESLCLCWEIF